MLLVGSFLAVAVVSGCGGNGSGWSDARCRQEAQLVAVHASSMVRHFEGSAYPPDMAYFGFQGNFERFQHRECKPAILGEALRKRLPPKRRATLLRILPAGLSQSVRRALKHPEPH